MHHVLSSSQTLGTTSIWTLGGVWPVESKRSAGGVSARRQGAGVGGLAGSNQSPGHSQPDSDSEHIPRSRPRVGGGQFTVPLRAEVAKVGTIQVGAPRHCNAYSAPPESTVREPPRSSAVSGRWRAPARGRRRVRRIEWAAGAARETATKEAGC